MSIIKNQRLNPYKRAFGIGVNTIANSMNVILAVIFQWEFSVVVVCMYIQNFILMSFISLRINRLMGKNYIKLDYNSKAWSPEYSSPVGMIVMLWFAFSIIHLNYFVALNDVQIFSLAMTATNASFILVSCGGYFLYQCYDFFWVKPDYNIQRVNVNNEIQTLVVLKSKQLFKSICSIIIHFLPLFFVVFLLNNATATWLSALLVVVLLLELIAQLIEHDGKAHAS